MTKDPIERRFERRRRREQLDEYGRRARSTDDVEAEEELLRETEKVEPIHADAAPGRNDPCPCGSGRKYKKCCGAK